MSAQEVEATYITFKKIAEECGVSSSTPFNWANYHRFFEKHYVLGKPVALRAEYEAFKLAHPELIKTPAAV